MVIDNQMLPILFFYFLYCNHSIDSGSTLWLVGD